MSDAYRYSFRPDVPAAEVEATLLLAVWGAEALHGEVRVRLDAGPARDRRRRAWSIPAGTPAGRTVNRLFAGFARREFGPGGFRVDRVRPAGGGR